MPSTVPAATLPARLRRRAMPLFAVSALALLSACATQHPQLAANQAQEAASFRAHTRNYKPPGPPDDPWRPYIAEAAQRYDIPERWIREVMRVESGGQEYRNGEPVTSQVGAMGLMQVMPETYEELRGRYSELGDDPYDPHNSVLAGAAYLREMYDIYGNPGFLAAYNAGPRRLDDYLNRNRPLPDETRRYVAMIGPYITDTFPAHRSPAEQYASNALPLNIPPGPRRGYGAPTATMTVSAAPMRSQASRGAVQVAELPEPPMPAPRPMQMMVSAPPPPPRGGFHLIGQAYAESVPLRHDAGSAGDWAIQVGAFANEGLARAATASAHDLAPAARPLVARVQQGHATLYRARLTGLSREAAVQACEHLAHKGACTVLSPAAQS